MKSFKVTLAMALLPLAVYVDVWHHDHCTPGPGMQITSFQTALWLISMAGLWQALSILGIVLYRASGNVLIDNVRQLLRIVILMVVAVLSEAIWDYAVFLPG